MTPREIKASQQGQKTYPPRLIPDAILFIVIAVITAVIAQAIPGDTASIIWAVIVVIGAPVALGRYSANRACRHCGHTPSSVFRADFPVCERCGREKWA